MSFSSLLLEIKKPSSCSSCLYQAESLLNTMILILKDCADGQRAKQEGVKWQLWIFIFFFLRLTSLRSDLFWLRKYYPLSPVEISTLKVHCFICLFVCLVLGVEFGSNKHGMWDLSSPTRDSTHAPAWEGQSPNHRTAREVPNKSSVAGKSHRPSIMFMQRREGKRKELHVFSMFYLPHALYYIIIKTTQW